MVAGKRDVELAVSGGKGSIGKSYIAALMLQSLAVENRFAPVAVEGPFSSAREMSFERVSARCTSALADAQ